ncbi:MULTISPECIES: phosphate ABC transporter permease PstA [Piscirickettsiaceae]|jgi:phosphate transport system permease protein|uniref:Phosphate transport system permease protein PstA n=1 Tax=Hydrogenovibrio thermophilus TaxID=265883 RepID=A0A410H1H9_9GAMM|nr:MULTISPECIES: phosphate ABC transporter permease PstA [Piscirickettsiaceae]AZR82667.1 phosphate ABC transporter permease [Thiomicrospira sp. S5]QAB14767.1 phosphate ABC transporter permease PstA [Hydrogenovibrio thermophilus]
MKEWFKKGEHWVWFSASTVSISVVLVVGLLLMISFRGLVHFWPHSVYEYEVKTDNGKLEQVVGELHEVKSKEFKDPKAEDGIVRIPQYLLKVGNRDVYGIDFRWINSANIIGRQDILDDGVTVVERYEWGNVYGHLEYIKQDGKIVARGDNVLPMMQQLVDSGLDLHNQIRYIEKVIIGGINYKLEQLRLNEKRLETDGEYTAEKQAEFEAERTTLKQEFSDQQDTLKVLYRQSNNLGEVTLQIAGNKFIHVPLKSIVRFWQPNNMTFGEQVGFFFTSIGHFLIDDPREANTEGGVFPAIVGTVTMVILMAIFVTPMGVIAAVYMSEYAKDGILLRTVRISINNLAGVPSIVFGIFGLGFFVYIIGGSIDELFYSYALPSPTFGTPALLWASLTMALLTLPVVIVSTQEGLSRIPRALREGGLALGATKSETIMKIVLPMSMPAIMTGLILAVARAAGEVAPLMLVGVVKLAPELPIDLNAPFIHLDRKFMHLGFHIYDVGFQSPNVEASQPLVYATSLLLVLIIIGLNLGAITIRNKLREKYKALDN